MRNALAQHADALREEIQGEFTRQGDLMRTTRAASSRRTGVSRWLMPALLVLTCAGVFLLVAQRILGW
jgi:hypothetical protein